METSRLTSKRFLDIDGEKVFAEDIQKMDKQQIHMLCAFLGTESELRFVQSACNENFSYIIDNIIFKL